MGQETFKKVLSYCRDDSNVSTTPITAMGCLECLPLSDVQLIGKHCQSPHCLNGVVDTFGHGSIADVIS